ncbi:MAG TPA: nuclear transport factor 2 family protein [Ilumatobacteraceae bacterium]|nr:nuclear transport factor 2 family protein [Ilumatobacteraceae bacterium]
MDGAPQAVVERLLAATNAHDLDALVDCFSDDYRNETPAHPGRSFEGRAQVRANWKQIFAGVPDVTAEITASVADGDVVWSEWEMKGTRRDGLAHLMRGVIVFGTADGTITRARFYLEPVDSGIDNPDQAVRRIVASGSAAPAAAERQ